MASWMIHLRIADALLDRVSGLDTAAFVMGNIAPDSGVPNEDWSVFTPPKSVTHYHVQTSYGDKAPDVTAFCSEYFSPELISSYSLAEYSFFLGYYVHLLTDIDWAVKIYRPAMKMLDPAENRNAYIARLKDDWYDLDFRYLAEHPDFRAFNIYEQAVNFKNVYMKQFSGDAFDNRREYICSFYRGPENGELYRDYPYLSPEQADSFVYETVDKLCGIIQKQRGDGHDR